MALKSTNIQLKKLKNQTQYISISIYINIHTYLTYIYVYVYTSYIWVNTKQTTTIRYEKQVRKLHLFRYESWIPLTKKNIIYVCVVLS